MWKENNMYYPNYCHDNNYMYNYPNSDYNDYNDSCYNSNYYDNIDINSNDNNSNSNDNNDNDVVENFNTVFNFNHNTEDYNFDHECCNTNQENYTYNFFKQEDQSQTQSQYTFQNNFQEFENEKSNEVDEKFMIESEKLENIGYDIVVIRGDGNCLFRSVAEQLEGNEEYYQKYREICVDYMINNKEVFIPFLEDSISIDEYIEKISKDGEWGGNLEIYALSMALEVNFCIYIPDKPCSVVKNWENPKQNIFLIYHNGKHYNSLRKNKCIKNYNEKEENDDEKKEDDDEKKENQKEEKQKEKGEENKENKDKNIGEDKKGEKFDEINDFLNKVKNFCNYSF